jgi:hypothetical protein
MAIKALQAPRFNQNQTVRFVGGEGRVKQYLPDSQSWAYMVEMAMDPEPEIGRVGYETTILLMESDLQAFD